MRSYRDYLRFWYLNNGFSEPVFSKTISLDSTIVITAKSVRDGFKLELRPTRYQDSSSKFMRSVNCVRNFIWYMKTGELEKPLDFDENDYRILFEELTDYAGYYDLYLTRFCPFNVDMCLDRDYLELIAAAKGF